MTPTTHVTTTTPLAPATSPLESDAIKTVQLGILDAFAEFCAKHRLTWWLGYGTLLGAVRHHGFIPWDDDIDLLMPYPDFMRAISLLNEGHALREPYRAACNKLTDPLNGYYPYLKVCDTRTCTIQQEYRPSARPDEGVWIDVFPLQGAPESTEELHRLDTAVYHDFLFFTLCTWNFRAGGSALGTLSRLLALPLARLCGYQHWLERYDRTVATYPAFGSTPGCVVPHYGRIAYNSADFTETCLVGFEGRKLPAPAGFDAVLTTEYGDYWRYPPEDQRNSGHHFTAFWR